VYVGGPQKYGSTGPHPLQLRTTADVLQTCLHPRVTMLNLIAIVKQYEHMYRDPLPKLGLCKSLLLRSLKVRSDAVWSGAQDFLPSSDL